MSPELMLKALVKIAAADDAAGYGGNGATHRSNEPSGTDADKSRQIGDVTVSTSSREIDNPTATVQIQQRCPEIVPINDEPTSVWTDRRRHQLDYFVVDADERKSPLGKRGGSQSPAERRPASNYRRITRRRLPCFR